MDLEILAGELPFHQSVARLHQQTGSTKATQEFSICLKYTHKINTRKRKLEYNTVI